MSSAMHLVMLMYGCIGVVASKNVLESSKFSSVLVFGDSTVDPGNNNYLLTISKANHFPYGIDFPGHVATGRFSNGKLVSDFLASALNIKDTVPPFLNPDLSDQELLTGVSFASGESGIDELTASLTNVLSMDQQLQYFKAYTMKLKQIVGEDQAMQRLRDALVLISVGTNDFILNFHDFPSRRLMFVTIDAYQDYLLDKLEVIIKELYDEGCRNIGVAGLPPLGCVPLQMSLKFKIDRQCLVHQNADSEKYNRKLAQRLSLLQATLPQSKIVYGDLYHPLLNLYTHPQHYGMEVTNRGCCGSGYLEVIEICNAYTPLCSNHSKYAFWDNVHLTEASNSYLADHLIRVALPLFFK
ncbi:GDSL esterase/lipase At2g24560 isoform X1 [Vigna angularis]|uniref:GDSL esterase/lipase At2g24560 isoform X1 n=1 Tax=Phaseolus angularis TaxID=3914 RepID=UPI000809A000|nr:GDSL esterase/lipase At2g24560 isoform X1 [Vigna angularis]